MAQERQLATTCCIAGGGPAGIILGYLLARAAIDVTVLEKHVDFFRDFRGDTIHPSTFQIVYELGLLDEFLKVPHQEADQLHAYFNDTDVHIADFSHLPVIKPAVGFMPQWDFLDFFAEKAKQYPSFHLLMETEAVDIWTEGDNVVGLMARDKEGAFKIRADLTVAADGRDSVIREKAGMEIQKIGAPIDVLWFCISKQGDDPPQALLGRFKLGKILVMIERDKYWQIGYVIEKDKFEEMKQQGLEAFRKEVGIIAPTLAARVGELKTWDDVKLLRVAIDRLKRWYRPGLLCIGDSAHAMSPVGGVGINLAIQDAVAAANILYQPLRDRKVTEGLLKKVQDRRQFPTNAMQRLQILIQNGIVYHRKGKGREKLPFFFWLLTKFPFLRRFPARLVGIGFRPEHVHSPEK